LRDCGSTESEQANIQHKQMSGSHSRIALVQGHDECVEHPNFLHRQPAQHPEREKGFRKNK
jgi:hypothetical protein